MKITHNKKFDNTETNLYIVLNQIHLINALEAKNKFKTKNDIFILIEPENQTKGLSKYISKLGNSQIIIFNSFYKTINIRERINLIKYLQQYKYKNIFIPYFSDFFRQLVCNLDYTNIVLIDDGTYNIVLYYELNNLNNFDMPSMLKTSKIRNSTSVSYKIIHFFYSIALNFIFKAKGLKNNNCNYSLIFFTIFKLPYVNDVKIFNNNYSLLKNNYDIANQKIISSTKVVYFLGQALHKSLKFTHKDYYIYIMGIISFYKNKKIVYIPHKSENKLYQKVIRKLISENFSVKTIDKPFEIYMLEQKEIPNHIASFFSSTLFTIKNIYPNINVTSFQFDNIYRDDINLIYSTMEKMGIEVIKKDNWIKKISY